VTRLTEKELADALSTHEVISDTGGTDMRKTEEHKALERRQKYNAVPTVLDGIRFASIEGSSALSAIAGDGAGGFDFRAGIAA
jgi:hypothetical protein